jgi:hypothetical protein
MSTPTPRTDAVYLEHRHWANEDEATEAIEDLRDLARELEQELAAERARLDWVFRNCKVEANDYTTGNRDVYAIHDREDLGAAMKEDAK